MYARKVATIGTLWGLAKAPELAMDSDALHAFVFRETGKSSLRQLTPQELEQLASCLRQMKDSVLPPQKRIDIGGNEDTVNQRRKIYMLTATLGWNSDNRRISAFAKRITRVERIEWLSKRQCNMVIEALKDMVARQKK